MSAYASCETERTIEDLDIVFGDYDINSCDVLCKIEGVSGSRGDYYTPSESPTATVYEYEVKKVYITSQLKGDAYESTNAHYLKLVKAHLDLNHWMADQDDWALEAIGDWEQDAYENEMEARADMLKERGL
jgi:hypothetical protein